MSPAEAHELLAAEGPGWWRRWDAASLQAACAAVPDAELANWPDVAHWRALVALMLERADALDCLELAYQGHTARGDHGAAAVDACVALVICLVDGGAAGSITRWMARAETVSQPPVAEGEAPTVWHKLGAVALAILGEQSLPATGQAADWLFAQLQPLRAALSPDERLIVAQVLINLYMVQGQFEKVDLIANAVGEPSKFDAASWIMRGHWLHTLGLTHYYIGNTQRAEGLLQRALSLAAEHGLVQLQLITSLASLRLLIDRGRFEEAGRLEAGIQPEWGAGRDIQLMDLKQLSARLLVRQDQPARALATLQEALALAEQIGLNVSERASCLYDMAQVLIANQRSGEALELLTRFSSEFGGRNAEVFHCARELLAAWHTHRHDETASRTLLAVGLRRAQQSRYTLFFHLLPWLAAEVCALALRWDIEPTLVSEVIRVRDLPAPESADARWPWKLYIRVFGSLDVRLRGEHELQKRKGKAQRKPLELLCVLACAQELKLGVSAAADALWPEADGDLARKSLEMTVQRLRRLLGDEDNSLVVVSDGQVWLDPGRVSSDWAQRAVLIRRLESLVLSSAPAGQCVEPIRRIVELTVGPLLSGVGEAQWLERDRQRCQRHEDRALRAVLALLARSGVSPEEKAVFETAIRELSPERP